MASKRVEDVHLQMIQKLLEESGLVCTRSPYESTESSEEIIEEHHEEIIAEEEEVESEEIQMEEMSSIEEITVEEFTDVFPTPSLRRMIPERIRKIEALNRIRTLPDNFRTDIDPAQIPKIRYTAPQVYIDKIAEITGCSKYKSNMAEYWFLDTLANLLRRAQEDELDRPTQAVLILWFCEWMREIQTFDAASRERMLRRWRDNMLSAAKFVADENYIPTPKEAGVVLSSKKHDTPVVEAKQPPNLIIFKENTSYECALKDLMKITHYIYDLFSTDYQYQLVRSIFTFSPEYTLINGPYQIEYPKRLFNPAKYKPKKEPKPKKPPKPKGKKAVIPDTPEYLALQELREKERQELFELECAEAEKFLKRTSILPLHLAMPEGYLDKYWPPPTPEVTLPTPTPEPKGKKKGKK